MFLDKVVFNKDFRTYIKNDEINFVDQITVLSGDNGLGKSTLIGCIRNLFDTKWTMSHCSSFDDVLLNKSQKDVKISYLDLSVDLFAVSPEIDFDNFELFQKCRQSSSGEGAIFQLADFIGTNNATPLLIIDEPEKGLSIMKQIKVANVIKKHALKNPQQQIIIATHSQYIMEITNSVLSLNHKFKHIPIQEYMEYMFFGTIR
jgi:predicted ATPase